MLKFSFVFELLQIARMTALGGYLIKCLDCWNLDCIECSLFTVQFLQLNSCLIGKKTNHESNMLVRFKCG